MGMSHQAGAVARLVRVASLALALSMLCGFVGVHAFMAQYGASTRPIVVDTSTDPALRTAVARQAAAGRQCSERPVLTDVVLFQHARGGKVAVLTFAQAVEHAAARDGWIRSYCVDPAGAGGP